jgi:hypothetical protein
MTLLPALAMVTRHIGLVTQHLPRTTSRIIWHENSPLWI